MGPPAHSPPAPLKLNIPSPTATSTSVQRNATQSAVPSVPQAVPVSTPSYQQYKFETSSYFQEDEEDFEVEDDFAVSGIDSPLKEAQMRWTNAVSQWKVLSHSQEKTTNEVRETG